MSCKEIDYQKIPELAQKMKSFFKMGRSVNTTSYMNWRVSKNKDVSTQFWQMASGYFQAADLLITACLKDNFDKKADIIIFPILFDIVQGIELSLKASNGYLFMILGGYIKIEGCHNIKQLVDVSISKLQKLKEKQVHGSAVDNEETEQAITAMKLIRNFIECLYEKTDDMAFTRYSQTKDEKEMFYVKECRNVVIDLELLQELLGYIEKMFDFISDYLYRQWDWVNEVNREIADF